MFQPVDDAGRGDEMNCRRSRMGRQRCVGNCGFGAA